MKAFTFKKIKTYFLVTLSILFFNINSWGQLPLTDITSGGVETVTIPAGVTCIRVQVWGGGGAGGGNSTNADGGGGGGGGGYSESYISVVPLGVYNYTVGAGGIGVLSSDGGPGGQSWFNNAATVMANPGNGGTRATAPGNRNGGLGGTAGVGNVVTLIGGDGGRGRSNATGTGGGGGSSAGTSLNGNGLTFNAFTTNIAPAAPAGGGIGGDGFLNGGGNGSNGTNPGGGGGGSGERIGAGSFVKGGDGATGKIIITASVPLCPTATTIAPAGAQSVCVGSATTTLTASVTTAGSGCPAALQYQWYSTLINNNTIATATLLPGQTTASLTPQNAVASTLYYFCVAYAPTCGQTAATQALASNQVQVIIVAPPTVSAAGPDQSICTGSSTLMAANAAVIGTGSWTILAGSPNTSTAQLSSAASATATFTPTLGGVYTLRWTITNAPCTASNDDIVITVGPTTSAAGPDQNLCITASPATLAANNPTIGVGAWSVTSGPSLSSAQFGNTAIRNTTFTPAGGAGTYVLTWTITSAGPCTSTDAVSITFVASPTASAAGPDQSVCIGTGAVLAANSPAIGTGAWTVVSGPSTSSAQFSSTSNANATFTASGGSGSYVLRWTISNAPCASSADDITVTITCGGACPACAVDYWQPTDAMAIANENVGNCLVADCGPANFYDNGGPAANYATGTLVGGTYRVFCPSIAGNCMTVTFNSFDTEGGGADYLTVGNGPTQNSTFFTTAPANGVGRIFGTPATPFGYTSSHPSGCLTFRFRENGNGTLRPGWAAVLSCTPCAGGPTGLTNSDCIKATPLCNTLGVASNSTGPGILAEGCSGVVCPAGGENHSNWYWFQAASTGTLNVTVTPTTASDDYDIAIYGPNVTCGALGSPLRCSDSGATGVTGAIGTPGDLTESVLGDKFVNQLNVVAGESYYLMVDEWTPTGLGFTLSFSGTATLDCTVLPIELSAFDVNYIPEENASDLHWKTESERNNDYFTIEKSINGVDYFELAIVDGAGTTNMATEYFAYDPQMNLGVTYYRLKQTDFDGAFKYSEIRSVNVLPKVNDILTLFPNPTSGKTEVIFNTYQKEITYLKVTDAKGFAVINREIECKSGGNVTEIDLSNYSQGIYFVTITTSDKVYSSKLIKE